MFSLYLQAYKGFFLLVFYLFCDEAAVWKSLTGSYGTSSKTQPALDILQPKPSNAHYYPKAIGSILGGGDSMHLGSTLSIVRAPSLLGMPVISSAESLSIAGDYQVGAFGGARRLSSERFRRLLPAAGVGARFDASLGGAGFPAGAARAALASSLSCMVGTALGASSLSCYASAGNKFLEFWAYSRGVRVLSFFELPSDAGSEVVAAAFMAYMAELAVPPLAPKTVRAYAMECRTLFRQAGIPVAHAMGQGSLPGAVFAGVKRVYAGPGCSVCRREEGVCGARSPPNSDGHGGGSAQSAGFCAVITVHMALVGAAGISGSPLDVLCDGVPFRGGHCYASRGGSAGPGCARLDSFGSW